MARRWWMARGAATGYKGETEGLAMQNEPINPIDPSQLDLPQVLISMQLAMASGDVKRELDKGEILVDQLEDIADLIYEQLHGEDEG
jgi:hypothetical protein